ncbi:MAG: hypothetical protein ABUR63_08665 [Verrucomicrobiota bacterium]
MIPPPSPFVMPPALVPASTAAVPAVATVSQVPPPAAGARPPGDDPQADRVILLPTAYTHPKGTVFVSNYDIALLQAGYAMTDQTQISVSAVPPLGGEGIAFFDLTLKTALAGGGLVRAAALGSVTGGVGNDIGTLLLGRIGGVVQLCMTPNCGSGFTLSSNGVLAGPVLLMVNGVGGTLRVGRRVSLLAEVEFLVPIGREGNQWNGAAVGGGVRFHFSHWGFDLALLRTARGKDALPLLTVTYRSAP